MRPKIQRKHVHLEAKLLEWSYCWIHTQVHSSLIGEVSTVDGHGCFDLGFDDIGHDQGPL